nr:hypothetical protein [Tanacetum cinerariifolium]
MSSCFEKGFTMMLLEHKDVISKFGSFYWWGKLRKETGCKISPSGDGSRWNRLDDSLTRDNLDSKATYAKQEEDNENEVRKAGAYDDDENDDASEFTLKIREKMHTPHPIPFRSNRTQSSHDVLRHWEDNLTPKLSSLRAPGA